MAGGTDPRDAKLTEGYISLGVVVRPHGLKGEVKVHLTCDGLERLISFPSLKLVKEGAEPRDVNIRKAFMHNDGDAVVRLEPPITREEAEALRGSYLAVRAGEEGPPPPDTYRNHDLIGLAVETEKGGRLGELREIIETPANAVFVVRDGSRETLIPALKAVVKKVDLKNRRMVVSLPGEIDAETAPR